MRNLVILPANITLCLFPHVCWQASGHLHSRTRPPSSLQEYGEAEGNGVAFLAACLWLGRPGSPRAGASSLAEHCPFLCPVPGLGLLALLICHHSSACSGASRHTPVLRALVASVSPTPGCAVLTFTMVSRGVDGPTLWLPPFWALLFAACCLF